MSDEEYACAMEDLRRTRLTVRRMQEANEANDRRAAVMREEGEREVAGWQKEASRQTWFLRWLVLPFFVAMFLFIVYITMPIFIEAAIKATVKWRALL